jgi:hypothetical protein
MASGPGKEFCVLAFMKICSYDAATFSIKVWEDFQKQIVDPCLVRGSKRPVQKLIMKILRNVWREAENR